jgi:hypothetical protein
VVLGLVLTLWARPALATNIGFIGGNAAGAITASGNTPVALANLTGADLAGLGVVWIFNPNNGTPNATIMNNLAAIAAFVQNGGVLSFHDRNVNQGISANQYLPGAGGTTFTAQLLADVNTFGPSPVTNGPAGVINDTTLDGGNFSTHGWALASTLPVGATSVLYADTDRTHIVDFWYQFGLGYVYYSTMPLDFYLAPGGNNPPGDAFRNIYAVNEAAFQASLAHAVPEPASMLLLGTGLGIARLVRRRK